MPTLHATWTVDPLRERTDFGLKGVSDPEVLARAAAERRVLLTHDLKMIPKHGYDRIKAGQLMPGVMAVPDTMAIGAAIEDLALVVECCQPSDLENRVFYLPL